MDLDEEENNHSVFQLDATTRAVRDAASYSFTGKTIVVLLDGTGDKFDDSNSNIIHLISALKKSDPSQYTYYQSGIGTYNAKGLSSGLDSAFDAAVGSGLRAHITDAYRFLMDTYDEGDKICLFGFSRGSYTARCLAGFVHKVGVLAARNYSQVDFAYNLYKDESDSGWKSSLEFKRALCMNVNVYFIGVFDSVASVGFIPRTLPLSSTPSNKSAYFRHAISMDEARAKFKVCRFKRRVNLQGKESWKVAAELTPAQSSTLTPESETDVLEICFVGCHCDVGGGAVNNDVRNRLANIPLRWMIRQCFECNTGILFKTHILAQEGLDIHMLSPVYHKLDPVVKTPSKEVIAAHDAGTLPSIALRSNILEQVSDKDDGARCLKISSKKQTIEHGWLPEQTEDFFDIRSPINDMLKIAKSWWILEVFPVKSRFQMKDSDDWVKRVVMNLGRPRVVQELRPKIHWTVQHRMEEMGYKPRIQKGRHAEWEVVH